MKAVSVKSMFSGFLRKLGMFFKTLFKKTRLSSINKTITVALLLIAAMILPNFPFATITLAYEVKSDDVTLGYVSGENVYKKAETIANGKVEGEISTTPEYTMKIVASSELSDADEISQKIIDNTDVSDAFGIYVNDNCIAVSTDKQSLLNALDVFKAEQMSKMQADYAEFTKKVEIKECLSAESEIISFDEIKKAVRENIVLKIGVISEKTVEIDYKTVNKDSDKYYKGQSIAETDGEKGEKLCTVVKYYIGGKKVEETVTEEKVIKKPVNKVILNGTKKLPDVVLKDGAVYAWPLDAKASCYISSPFGYRSGRLHKGIDIIADYGTGIVAADDGVVTRASWFESYGNCVDIRHSDGTVTRYAHCSSISVSVGDNVVMGQVIANVGSTGRSTANHLHFEVIKNGSYVNPSNYVKK